VTLPATGTDSSSWRIAFWGVLLLVFGRITLLAARPHRMIVGDNSHEG